MWRGWRYSPLLWLSHCISSRYSFQSLRIWAHLLQFDQMCAGNRFCAVKLTVGWCSFTDCLGSSAIPTGDFFCPDCQQQRFGGIKDRRRALVKRRVKGASKTLLTKDRITGRCTRLLQVPEAVTMGGCVFCK